MRIAVNTRLLIKDRLEGIGWFACESLKRITREHPEHEFFFIFDRKHHEDFIFSGNITPVSLAPQARHPLLYYLWFEHSIPRALKRINADLFFSPDGYLSLSARTRSMNVFHDLSFEHHPEFVPYTERKYYRKFFPKYADKAVRIATVSEFSKRDIIQKYHQKSEKIDVVYNGAGDFFRPLPDREKIAVREKFTEGDAYFIYVGSLHPRKNIENLLRAFDLFRKETGSPVKLLIVGEKMFLASTIGQTLDEMEYKKEVVFTGRLEPEELGKAMGAALALTYVSFFEGFGIPIVEAMYAGVPVITSDITSMPEVAGDAALLANPHSPQSICKAMITMYENDELRGSFIDKGNIRKEEFSWDKTAGRLWESIEKALS